MKFAVFVFLILFSNLLLYSQSDYLKNEDTIKKSIVMVLGYSDDGDILQGSGIVIDDQGRILTNYHVCFDAVKILIKINENELSNAQILGFDDKRDLLLLQTKSSKIKPIKTGDIRNLFIGQKLYAIGNQDGADQNISAGVFKGFYNDNNNNLNLQTTTTFFEGFSGGALVNDQGELVGIPTSGFPEKNLYNSIPVNTALNFYDNVLKEKNENDYKILSIAKREVENNNHIEAEKYFSRYLELNQNELSIYIERGLSNYNLKQYEKAIQDFSFVISNQYRESDVYYYRANTYYRKYLYDSAISDYNKAIAITPELAELYYNKGFAEYKKGKINEAIDDWKNAIRIKPEFSDILNPIILSIEK